MTDSITASDFSAAETSISSEPAAAATADTTSPAPVDASAPPEAATTAPADATAAVTPTTEPTKPAGPVPLEVHTRALENARTKAVADYKQQYGWAEQIPQADVQEAVRIAQLSQRDPIGYLQEFVKDLQNHPTYGAQLKSLAAKALAQRGTQSQQGPDLNPIQVQLEDGRTVGLFSADQIAALKSQWFGEVEQRFQPVFQTHETLQAERAATQRQLQVDNFVSTTHGDVLTWPGMQDKANQIAVAQALAAAKVESDDPREVSLALNAAYRAVVLPKLQSTSRQSVVDDITRSANASTVNPAHPSTRAPKPMDQMSIAEALQHVAAQSV
jgi:hypothetical protein